MTVVTRGFGARTRLTEMMVSSFSAGARTTGRVFPQARRPHTLSPRRTSPPLGVWGAPVGPRNTGKQQNARPTTCHFVTYISCVPEPTRHSPRDFLDPAGPRGR